MKKDKIGFSNRLNLLPPYLFMEVDRMKKEAVEKGMDIINLGVGDPDIPTPKNIREAMKSAVDNSINHKYPLGKGKDKFRQRVKGFFKQRFNVSLNPDTQIQPLIGSKEGIAHLPLAFINSGDRVIVPEPAYPVYNSGTIFAGGKPFYVSLRQENGFLPDWEEVPNRILNKVKLVFLNYPNNPTGGTATREFFESTLKLASKYGFIVAHDAAYSEIYFDRKPLSLLEVDKNMEYAVEFHSFSKTYSMTGWRIGWACGNEKVIKGLGAVKGNIDSGVFGAVQDAAVNALDNYKEISSQNREIYKSRLDEMSKGLKSAGWSFSKPKAAFYLWAKPPADKNSIDSVIKIIKETGIICTPGSGFGPSGEGYVRFALTKDIDRIKQAVDRLKELKWQKK